MEEGSVQRQGAQTGARGDEVEREVQCTQVTQRLQTRHRDQPTAHAQTDTQEVQEDKAGDTQRQPDRLYDKSSERMAQQWESDTQEDRELWLRFTCLQERETHKHTDTNTLNTHHGGVRCS